MKAILAIATLALLAHTARAEKDKDKADALFKQGKKLMAEKHYADACQAFEQSYKLDPGIGGELNIAKCYEEWGKLGRALRAYQAAEQQAKEASDPRADKIHELVAQLEPQVPRLTIRVPAGAATEDAAVTLDGASLGKSAFGQPQLVDPGPHQVEYTINGAKKSKVVPVERGGSSEISLDLPTKTVKPDKPDNVVPDKVVPDRGTEDPGHTQKLAAYATGGVGVVAIGIASYLTLSARSKYKTALATDCGGITNNCDAAGLTATHDARHEANIATFVFVAGLAAVGGGVALYLLAPHAKATEEHALYLVPTVAPDGGGLAFGGRL